MVSLRQKQAYIPKPEPKPWAQPLLRKEMGNKTEDGEVKMSFDEVRDSLVISFTEGSITDEEFLI